MMKIEKQIILDNLPLHQRIKKIRFDEYLEGKAYYDKS
jgi:hypothetical protein